MQRVLYKPSNYDPVWVQEAIRPSRSLVAEAFESVRIWVLEYHTLILFFLKEPL